jgi:uncharacterized membrane protein
MHLCIKAIFFIDMETNLNFQNNPIEEQKVRPVFLTVLCILSFIGSSLGLIGAILGYISARVSAELYQNIGSVQGEEPIGVMGSFQDSLLKEVENALPNLIIGVLCSVLCLVGAILMWKLNRKGFFIYSLSELAYPISGFILSAGGLFGGIVAAFNLIVAIVFVVMYGMNYKHLK